MSATTPPIEAQRFGRSQTPESPRPVYIPEPANIPVLMNQMDPVFNDTATYNIPNNQSFSPYTESLAEQGLQNPPTDEHDLVQSFFREAENQAAAEPIVTQVQSDVPVATATVNETATYVPKFPSNENTNTQANQTQLLEENKSYESQNTTSEQPAASPQVLQSQQEANPDDHMIDDKPRDGNEDGQPQKNESSIPEAEGGVDYQSLLDTIAQSASTAPSAESLTVPTTAASQAPDTAHSLPSIPGLPAKPPPQENPIEFPSFSYTRYANGDQTQTETIANADQGQNQDQAQTSTEQNGLTNPQAFNEQASAMNGFNQTSTQQNSHSTAPGTDIIDIRRSQDPNERPWTPRTQSIYDQFLEDERRYVTEGIWDKFPTGSRLFVGNLPSEKVTKRDLFHTFHKYGQLAQVSIKQAYGFVQFLEAAACAKALSAEQGVEIRGRKVHLEISKPQRNTKNASGAGGSGNKNQARRRSRSPDRSGRRSYSDYRDEPNRRRDEYRNRRSPSPRGYRARTDFRPDSRDSRSPPVYGSNYGAPIVAYDDEQSLPLPRRDPRSVPDVQLLVLEPEIVQSFINWVEQAFRAKGLQASTIWLNQRLPLAAVIKRQIMEGVQAVVKLTRTAQNNSKIPLQVFDRTAGASNVNFNEYADLDTQVAADIVVQARAKERSQPQGYRPQPFPPGPPLPGYPQPNPYLHPQNQTQFQPPMPPPIPSHYPQQPPTPQQQYPYPQQQAGYRAPSQPQPTPPAQPPNLQQLLANLRHPAGQQSPQAGQPSPISPFGNVPSQQYPYGQVNGQQQLYGQFPNSQPPQGYAGVSQQGHQQQNVQNVMEQLARYQR